VPIFIGRGAPLYDFVRVPLTQTFNNFPAANSSGTVNAGSIYQGIVDVGANVLQEPGFRAGVFVSYQIRLLDSRFECGLGRKAAATPRAFRRHGRNAPIWRSRFRSVSSLSSQSIFRRSVQRFAAENATNIQHF